MTRKGDGPERPARGRGGKVRRKASLSADLLHLTPAESARLVHELQVHQVELEMQNEELRRTRAHVEALLAQYTDLYDFAPVGYLALDRDGTIRQVNLAAARMLGTERSLLKAQAFRRFVDRTDLDSFGEFLGQVFQGRPGVTCEVSLLSGPTAVRIDGAGTPGESECRLVMVDVTQEKELLSHVLQSQKMETVGRMAGGVAHDFNNLLTVIISTVELAGAGAKDNEALRGDLDAIHAAADRAAFLTRQLLAFGRRTILQPRTIDLNSVITRMQPTIKRLVGEHITVLMRPADRLGSVHADVHQVEQVILNLVANSRDAMPTGGTLTIETHDVELDEAFAARPPAIKPGSYVALSVSDTGVGMAETTRLRAFEPFFTTKAPGEASGLGLSTAYGIVQQSNGTIRVESNLGRGTTVTLYLPLVFQAPEVNRSVKIQKLPSGSETILVVDDEVALLGVVRRVLSAAGYRVLTAGNGIEALEVLRNHHGPVHLLLTDLIMPGMGGRELAARVSQMPGRMKILFTSGYAGNDSVRHELGGDAGHFIGKPYGIGELMETVRAVLDEPAGTA